MINNQIEKLKNIQFSITFKNWVSTLLFLPLAIYFRFIIGTSLVLDKDFPAYTRTVWILGLVSILWLGWKWLFDDRLIRSGVDKYLGFFFLATCLSTAFSINPGFSLEKLIGISSYLLGFYLLLDLKRSPKLWQGIINALLITAGLSSLLILIPAFTWIKLYQITPLQILTNPAYLLRVIPRLPYTIYLHPSVTAGYLVMILPLGFYQLIQSKKIFWKVFQALGLFLHLSVFFLTQSRGGLLGFLCLLVVLAVLYRKKIWDFIFQSKIRGLLAVAALSLAGTGYIFLMGRSRGFSLSDFNVQIRFHLWSSAFKIIQENPWFGSGLGTFAMKYLEVRDATFDPGTMIHAHNQLIQITTELGILGLITLLMIFWQIIRQLRKEPGGLPATSRVALTALGGLFGVLIPDAIFTSSMIVLLFIFYLVWILPPQKDHLSFPKPWGLGLLSLAAVLLACGGGWIIWKIQPYNLALVAAEQDNWQEASTALLSTLERDPDNPYYQHALGYIHGQVACQSGEGYDESLAYYQQSFESYNRWGIDHANAGMLFAASGDYQNAANQMKTAIQLFPQNSFFNCLLGDYYLQLNKPEDAVQSYKLCIADNPHYLDSPYWQEEQSKKELLPAVIDQVETYLENRDDEELLKQLAELYLATGEVEDADRFIQEYLLQYPDDLEGTLIYFKILESAGDLSTAEEKIKQLLLSYPRNPVLWNYQGVLALEAEDDKFAEYSLNISYRLNSSWYSAWILGLYHQSQGDLQKARGFYQKALSPFYPRLDFSSHVAARWPLKGIYVNCMPEMRTYSEYFDPALEAAQSLEDQDCILAACIYQGLLDINPSIKEAQIRLEELSCAADFDQSQCFFNESD